MTGALRKDASSRQIATAAILLGAVRGFTILVAAQLVFIAVVALIPSVAGIRPLLLSLIGDAACAFAGYPTKRATWGAAAAAAGYLLALALSLLGGARPALVSVASATIVAAVIGGTAGAIAGRRARRG